MKIIKRIATGFGIFLLVFFLFLVWYKHTYSMDRATSFTRGNPQAHGRVLIATQGSAFKDSLVNQIIAGIARDSVFVTVIDVSGLDSIREVEWKAIVLIHDWEMWKAPPVVTAFVSRLQDHSRVVDVTTSGGGTEKLPGVDAISSASKLSEVKMLARTVSDKVSNLLNRP